MSDPLYRPAAPRGFSTRAIRAASRIPSTRQTPTSVPIFEVEGGRDAGRAIIDRLILPERTASLGSVHTMVVHPPSMSHRQPSEAELLAAGISPGLLRVSVGLEDVEDLQADFADALAAVRTTRPSAATAV